MDTSYLAQQVNSSIGQLNSLFDEIGVPAHERQARESELFSALSEALNNQVRIVNSEKKGMIDDAKNIITAIRQMETSLDDFKSRRDYDSDEITISYPLNLCLQSLKEKHSQIMRLHRERYEQVKKLAQALESYSSHLEPTFVQIPLPPTGPNQSIPTTFDLSPSYVDRLDTEFNRVYDEYTHRVASVQSLANSIIQLWAELGTPQAQQEGAIVKYYRDAPEQLGLHTEDLKRLQSKRERLSDEKKSREKKLRDLKAAVESLWAKLGVDEAETKAFGNANRGCGLRQINEFEDELARLNEMKRQNLHLFVEDSRIQLQALWDALYFSEDEMLDFSPAFSDVYSDALLEAHEREIARLEALKEQRAPVLALVDRHKNLIKERDELAASSQDASRLMLRGQKGEKRDPGKLLREEKMRKRIAKELPKVAAEVRKVLEQWEDEYGRPFLVFGERYLDECDEDGSKRAAPTTRSKTPAGAPPSTVKMPKSAPNKANIGKTVPSRTLTKTPTATGPKKAATTAQAVSRTESPTRVGRTSPSRIPARAPLSTLKNGSNSPERPRPASRGETLRNGAPIRAPPPKMRDLKSVPELQTPCNPYRGTGLGGNKNEATESEDVYDQRPRSRGGRCGPPLHQGYRDYGDYGDERFGSVRDGQQYNGYTPKSPPRQISGTSTVISGSENWETYDDNSEPEPDASDAYYAKLRAARCKRQEPEYGHNETVSQPKRMRGIPPPKGYTGPVMIDEDGNRIVSGSEWGDSEVY